MRSVKKLQRTGEDCIFSASKEEFPSTNVPRSKPWTSLRDMTRAKSAVAEFSESQFVPTLSLIHLGRRSGSSALRTLVAVGSKRGKMYASVERGVRETKLLTHTIAQ